MGGGSRELVDYEWSPRRLSRGPAEHRVSRVGTERSRRLRLLRLALGLPLAIAVSAVCAYPAGASVPANGRAWELITPASPVGGNVASLFALGPNSDRLVYMSVNPMPGAAAGDLLAANIAVRGEDGWRTEPLSVPHERPTVIGGPSLFRVPLSAASDDLSSFVFSSPTPLFGEGPPEPRLGVYRIAVDGGHGLIADLGDAEALEDKKGVVGVSADTGHVVLRTSEHLLPGDAGRTQGESVYESVAGLPLRQVDVADDGSLLSECGSSVPQPGGVSRSGERIFFVHPVSCEAPARVYLREAGSTTVEVSASRCDRPDCDEPQPVGFAGATPTGSVVYLTTTQQLVDEDVNAVRDLYRFDVESGALGLVSPGSAEMEGAVVDREVTTSVDGSSTYFYVEGRLWAGDGSVFATNLYRADGEGLHFVAEADRDDPLEISPDGRVAVLATAAPLLAADTDTVGDVYRYDANTDTTKLLSSGPTGGTDDEATIAPAPRYPNQPFRRAITADGRRVFFTTAEPLVVEDRNEVGDLYEWSEGRLGLVSSGTGDDAAEFTAASSDGGTVVFRTAATLLPRDRDGGEPDLYAARIGGGFPEAVPPGEPCTRCGAAASPLNRSDPASAGRRQRRRRGRLRLRSLGDDAAREAATSGRLSLAISVPAPGLVTARGTGELAGEPSAVMRGSAGAVRPGRLRLVLRVVPEARRQLKRAGTLAFDLVLRQGDRRLARSIVLRLGKR